MGLANGYAPHRQDQWMDMTCRLILIFNPIDDKILAFSFFIICESCVKSNLRLFQNLNQYSFYEINCGTTQTVKQWQDPTILLARTTPKMRSPKKMGTSISVASGPQGLHTLLTLSFFSFSRFSPMESPSSYGMVYPEKCRYLQSTVSSILSPFHVTYYLFPQGFSLRY